VWEDGHLSYAELDRRAQGFARHLAEQGVATGDRIALSLPNGLTFVVALLGGLKLGATVALLNPQLTVTENQRLLDDLEPACLVDHGSAVDDGEWTTAADPGVPGIVLYTSGSTGRPKGALLSHAALAFANRSWAGPVMQLTPADRVLAVLPFPHSLGLNGGLLAPLISGASAVMLERFTPEAVLTAIARHRVTFVPGVATMFRRLLASPALARADFGSVRLALSGAAPCPWDLAQEWRQRTGVRILRGYGLTEVFRPISYLADDPRDLPDAIGRVVPGVEARVIDDEGRMLPAGDVGELVLQTPAVMDGYLNAPAETEAVLRDGWFRTGDLATLTPEGFVRIAGRKKDLILRGGYSISPQEVEAVLLTCPDIAEAAVTGVAHDELGEEVAAFVTLQPGATATIDALSAWCRSRLAPYKCPRRFTVLAELPKSATGKILKSRLASAMDLAPIERVIRRSDDVS
jgi:long-chain acyl-CoA synthetase